MHKQLKSIFILVEMKADTLSSYRALVDTITNNLKCLENIQLDTSSWDPLIIFFGSSKLDLATIRDWEQYKIAGNFPPYKNLKHF